MILSTRYLHKFYCQSAECPSSSKSDDSGSSVKALGIRQISDFELAEPKRGQTILAANFRLTRVLIQGQSVVVSLVTQHKSSSVASAPDLQDELRMASPKQAQPRRSTRPPLNGRTCAMDLRCAYLAAMSAVRSEHRSDVNSAPKTLETLIGEASDILRHLQPHDSRGRLLHTALMRRDYALLAAVVRSVEIKARETNRPVLWTPAATRRQVSARALRASERPTQRPPRRIAAE